MTKEEALKFIEDHRKASKDYALECLIHGVTDTYAWHEEERTIDEYFNSQIKKVEELYEGKN